MPNLYLGVIAEIERRIREGELVPEQPLPPIDKLAEELRVGKSTLKVALRALRERGLIQSIHGKATYVAVDANERLRAEAAAKLHGDGS